MSVRSTVWKLKKPIYSIVRNFEDLTHSSALSVQISKFQMFVRSLIQKKMEKKHGLESQTHTAHDDINLKLF